MLLAIVLTVVCVAGGERFVVQKYRHGSAERVFSRLLVFGASVSLGMAAVLILPVVPLP